MLKKIILLFLICNFLPLTAENNSILLVAAPRVAGGFIIYTLERSLYNLGYRRQIVSENRFPNDRLKEKTLQLCQDRNILIRNHMEASDHNLKLMQQYLPKFVLHVRDPRQVVLAWTRLLEVQAHDQQCPPYLHPPRHYYQLSLEGRVSWQIEHFLPVYVNWLEEWSRVVDSGKFNVLVTRFEDLVKDNAAFMQKIFTFYNLKNVTLCLPSLKDPRSHFRKGETDEWKRVMTEKQIARMHEIIPTELLQCYGWEETNEPQLRVSSQR